MAPAGEKRIVSDRLITDNSVLEFLTGTNAKTVHSRLSDRVYDYILNQIFEQKLKPASRITESQVAEELQISMVSVREAMAKLAQDGWVERYPNRGSYVSNYTAPDQLRELFLLRAAIEIGSFYFLAERITPERLARIREILDELEMALQNNNAILYRQADANFHQAVVYFTAGSRISKIFGPILMQSLTFSAVKANEPQDYLSNTVDAKYPDASHRSLFEALSSQDKQQAARIAERHISFAANSNGLEL